MSLDSINVFDLCSNYPLLLIFDCPTGISVNSQPYQTLSEEIRNGKEKAVFVFADTEIPHSLQPKTTPRKKGKKQQSTPKLSDTPKALENDDKIELPDPVLTQSESDSP